MVAVGKAKAKAKIFGFFHFCIFRGVVSHNGGRGASLGVAAASLRKRQLHWTSDSSGRKMLQSWI